MHGFLPGGRGVSARVVAIFLGFIAAIRSEAAGPVVTNVRAAQRAGTELVDIFYDVSASAPPLIVAVQVSEDGGASFAVNAVSFTGDVGGGLQPGSNKHVVWNAGTDWDGQFSSQVKFKVTANDSAAPPSMALIPAGIFQMGNSTNAAEGSTQELPVHPVYVSAFYADPYEVTNQLWNEVREWGLSNGYIDLPLGSTHFEPSVGITSYYGGEANRPVNYHTWYDVVKWCNARSEWNGRTPVYCTNDAQTIIYRTGEVNVTNLQVRWNANGYRLPTEAEWEKAARGGPSSQRFPWGATISHTQANYYSSSSYSYDVSPTRGFHPDFVEEYFSDFKGPPGSFVPNSYGLYDMAGNVREWVWDWYGENYYDNSPGSDPQGPPNGAFRVFRGGDCVDSAPAARVAYRDRLNPGNWGGRPGLRCVRR